MDHAIHCPDCGNAKNLEMTTIRQGFEMGWCVTVILHCPCGAEFDVAIWGDMVQCPRAAPLWRRLPGAPKAGTGGDWLEPDPLREGSKTKTSL
jgi:hypothetical protein